jgi:carbon storage regulator
MTVAGHCNAIRNGRLMVEEVRMLVLSRKVSQQIQVGSDILITVVKIDRNQVRLGISAPAGVTILRDELVNDRQSSVQDAPASDHRSAPIRSVARQLCTFDLSA